MGDRDTQQKAWDFTSSDRVSVSGERGAWRSALESPVIIMFLCVYKLRLVLVCDFCSVIQ